MRIAQDFALSSPPEAVWAFFRDVPAVAACLPGAEYLGPKEGGGHLGRMAVKVGPFQASFEGEAEVSYDEAARRIALQGKGVDRKGASRGRMTMDVALTPEGAGTRVAVEAEVQLQGAIAQFGRTGIVQEIAGLLVADFVQAVEARLGAEARAAAAAQAAAAAADAQPAGRADPAADAAEAGGPPAAPLAPAPAGPGAGSAAPPRPSPPQARSAPAAARPVGGLGLLWRALLARLFGRRRGT